MAKAIKKQYLILTYADYEASGYLIIPCRFIWKHQLPYSYHNNFDGHTAGVDSTSTYGVTSVHPRCTVPYHIYTQRYFMRKNLFIVRAASVSIHNLDLFAACVPD